MCHSNLPCTTPLPGNFGDITFILEKTSDVPTPRATKKSDKPWYGANFLVIFRIFVRIFGFYRNFEGFFGSWDPSDTPHYSDAPGRGV